MTDDIVALVARPSLWTVAELLGGGFLFRDFKVPREPPPRRPRQTCITRLENTRLDKAWLPGCWLGTEIPSTTLLNIYCVYRGPWTVAGGYFETLPFVLSAQTVVTENMIIIL